MRAPLLLGLFSALLLSAPGCTPCRQEVGIASYYADSLAGNATASGEPYRPGQRTAAHKTLPFGTRVKVTRIDTGESVTVRVNDRGPFIAGRVIDVSRSAARALDMIRAGIVRVRLEYCEEGGR